MRNLRKTCWNYETVKSPYEALLHVKRRLKKLEGAIKTVLDQSQLDPEQSKLLIDDAEAKQFDLILLDFAITDKEGNLDAISLCREIRQEYKSFEERTGQFVRKPMIHGMSAIDLSMNILIKMGVNGFDEDVFKKPLEPSDVNKLL